MYIFFRCRVVFFHAHFVFTCCIAGGAGNQYYKHTHTHTHIHTFLALIVNMVLQGPKSISHTNTHAHKIHIQTKNPLALIT